MSKTLTMAFQSTDFANNNGQIIDLGMIISKNTGEEIDRLSLKILLGEDTVVSESARLTWTAGLLEEVSEKGVTLADAVSHVWYFLSRNTNEFKDWLTAQGHNVKHDLGLLSVLMKDFPACLEPIKGDVQDTMTLAGYLNEAASGNLYDSKRFPVVCEIEGITPSYTSAIEKAELIKLLWGTMMSNLSDLMNSAPDNSILGDWLFCPYCGGRTTEDESYSHRPQAKSVSCVVCGRNHIIQEF